MSTNPFTKDIYALQRERDKSSKELQDWTSKFAWFQGFNLDQENFNLRQAERLESESQAKLYQSQQAVVSLASSIKQLELQASMGIDPLHWFSSGRAVAQRQLVKAQLELVEQPSRIAGTKIEISKAAEQARKIQGEVAIARAFDPLLAQSAIAALQANLERIEPQLSSLLVRSNDLNHVLWEPLDTLDKLEEEQKSLTKRISRAEALDTKLTNESNGSERAKIHDICDRELGDPKPRIVLQQSRAELRGVDAKIGKVQARVDRLIQFATWDIRHIVIDGNNLCYESKHFLKLAALEALVPILAMKYKVTLIFDANIRRKLQLSSKEIEARFPQAERVHIVASKHAADETVLAAASDDPHAFVLSNDRFIDYPEKMVVKEGRVLQHEIVGPVAYIHELQIEARFDVTPETEAV